MHCLNKMNITSFLLPHVKITCHFFFVTFESSSLGERPTLISSCSGYATQSDDSTQMSPSPRPPSSDELDLDGQGGKMFLRVLLNMVMHNYPSLVSGALQLLFRHFSQRQEVLNAFTQVSGHLCTCRPVWTPIFHLSCTNNLLQGKLSFEQNGAFSESNLHVLKNMDFGENGGGKGQCVAQPVERVTPGEEVGGLILCCGCPLPISCVRCQYNVTRWGRSHAHVLQQVKLSDVSLGTCLQYSLVVDEGVKKPTKQTEKT